MFNYNGVLSLFYFVSVIVKKFNGSFAKHAAVIASNVQLACGCPLLALEVKTSEPDPYAQSGR